MQIESARTAGERIPFRIEVDLHARAERRQLGFSTAAARGEKSDDASSKHAPKHRR